MNSTLFLVTRQSLNRQFASPGLVRRMISANWISVVRKGGPGRETLYDFASAQLAFERFKSGEEPLPLSAKPADTRGLQ